MLKFETESGAVYHVDTERNLFMRLGGYSPRIRYELHPDGDWHRYRAITSGDIEVGKRVAFQYDDLTYRLTTEVTSIE